MNRVICEKGKNKLELAFSVILLFFLDFPPFPRANLQATFSNKENFQKVVKKSLECQIWFCCCSFKVNPPSAYGTGFLENVRVKFLPSPCWIYQLKLKLFQVSPPITSWPVHSKFLLVPPVQAKASLVFWYGVWLISLHYELPFIEIRLCVVDVETARPLSTLFLSSFSAFHLHLQILILFSRSRFHLLSFSALLSRELQSPSFCLFKNSSPPSTDLLSRCLFFALIPPQLFNALRFTRTVHLNHFFEMARGKPRP